MSMKRAVKKRYQGILAWLIILCLFLDMVVGCAFMPEGYLNVEAAEATPVSSHGKLSVSGTKLVDQYGQPFQIHGISTHGLQWFSQYNNKDAYKTLRDDWYANCIRLAMYTGENGYCTGNQSFMKDQVTKGVQYATELGMYAIIDWHILNDGNPQTYKNQAINFFSEMSGRYKDYNNIIYEICNEPNGCDWQTIKDYAVEVIAAIRARDPDAVIIVGTPTWSQLGSAGHLYEPADNPITGYNNLMYAFHFYASDAAHNQWLKDKISVAVGRGLPVFVSEFGLSQASGDGNVDLGKSAEWLNRCDQYQVSYCAWSLSNDWRSSSLIKSSCQKTSNWSSSELTIAGNFIRDWYRQKAGFSMTAGTWVKDGHGWWYRYYTGGYPAQAWEYIDNVWYWFDSDGYMATGWRYIDGTWYYLTASGAMATGWILLGNTWYYMNGSGAMLTGWQTIGNVVYYLDSSGAMATGWRLLDNTWYYFHGSGAMATGWLLLENTWYYLDENGKMATGFKEVGNAMYYLDVSGAMATGWKLLDNTWYYFQGSGAMATGWLLLGNTWYYLDGDGKMLTGHQTIDGIEYVFDASGAWRS